MEIKAYIESGVLELYVLGYLSEKESSEVETMRMQNPEVREEIEAIEEALHELSFLEQKTPPSFLKEVIMKEIMQEEDHATLPVSTPSFPKFTTTSSVLYWAIAASIIGVISTVATIFYFNELNHIKQEFASLQHKNEICNQELAIFKNPDFKQIDLAKVDSLNDIKPAHLYWNEHSKEVFISWSNKASLPADQQYQLWAIVDGKPVDAGVFDITDSLQKMKLISNASAFAVTIEKKGGSPEPTLSTMVVLGKVS